MAGIKRLSVPPNIRLEEDGVAFSLTSGNKIANFSMSWSDFTDALHAANAIFVEGEAARHQRRRSAH